MTGDDLGFLTEEQWDQYEGTSGRRMRCWAWTAARHPRIQCKRRARHAQDGGYWCTQHLRTYCHMGPHPTDCCDGCRVRRLVEWAEGQPPQVVEVAVALVADTDLLVEHALAAAADCVATPVAEAAP